MFRLRALIQVSNVRDKYFIPKMNRLYSHRHSHQYPIVNLEKDNIKEKAKNISQDIICSNNTNIASNISNNSYILLDDFDTKIETSSSIAEDSSVIAEQSSMISEVSSSIMDAISGLKDL